MRMLFCSQLLGITGRIKYLDFACQAKDVSTAAANRCWPVLCNRCQHYANTRRGFDKATLRIPPGALQQSRQNPLLMLLERWH
jgi:hypothetical protein